VEVNEDQSSDFIVEEVVFDLQEFNMCSKRLQELLDKGKAFYFSIPPRYAHFRTVTDAEIEAMKQAVEWQVKVKTNLPMRNKLTGENDVVTKRVTRPRTGFWIQCQTCLARSHPCWTSPGSPDGHGPTQAMQ
jgi:hypothetical protein